MSRESLVETLSEALRGDASAPLTMARAAQAAGCSPMSMYRYFTDRDDLAAALTRHIMRESRSRVDAGASWQDRVRAWMVTVYEQSRLYPQVFDLAASGESPAWVLESVFLSGILKDAGLSRDDELADAVFLIGTTSLGQAMVRAAHRDLPLPSLYSVLGHLSAADAQEAAALVPYFAAMGDRAIELIIDATIGAVEAMVARRHRPSS
jgi:AcrR family transcriptional regulator